MKSKFLKQGLAVLIILTIITACGQTGKKESKEKVSDTENIEVVLLPEVDVWIIDEHQMNNVPITSKAAPKMKEVEIDNKKVDAAAETAIEEAEYEIYASEVLQATLEEQAYEATEVVEENEAAIPVDETQTVVAYNKKGKEISAFQVISSGPDNEVEQIIFTDKKHTDIYDVKAGMTGKEVKRLRKEMKHMVKKGQVFLYDDESNIMYLMEAKDMEGDEIYVEDVESMDVQAVIWKDKKHHKNN